MDKRINMCMQLMNELMFMHYLTFCIAKLFFSTTGALFTFVAPHDGVSILNSYILQK